MAYLSDGLEAGLRARELGSLTPASFDFVAQPPTVTVEAAYSKHRRNDVLPLRSDLAEVLKDHLANKLPHAPAFNMPKSVKTARMIRHDLAAAREAWIAEAATPDEEVQRRASTFLAYRDDAGRVADFHALRHTFITNLATSGAHPKVTQLLARHSTITLTMDRYTHSRWDELGEALKGLPDVSQTRASAATATPSEGQQVQASQNLASRLAGNGSPACIPAHSGATIPGKQRAEVHGNRTHRTPG